MSATSWFLLQAAKCPVVLKNMTLKTEVVSARPFGLVSACEQGSHMARIIRQLYVPPSMFPMKLVIVSAEPF